MKEKIENALKNNVSRKRYTVIQDSGRTLVYSSYNMFSRLFFRDIMKMNVDFFIAEFNGKTVAVFPHD